MTATMKNKNLPKVLTNYLSDILSSFVYLMQEEKRYLCSSWQLFTNILNFPPKYRVLEICITPR